jgi:preprotein translocase subunit SecE
MAQTCRYQQVNMAEVQTPAGASARDTVLMALSVLVLLAGIVAFYWFDEQALPVRILMVIVGLAAGAGLMWFTWYGREFWQFVLAARVELRKVVWPERDETVKTTYVVFGFAIVMGLFFWLLDMGLTFLTRLLGGQAG